MDVQQRVALEPWARFLRGMHQRSLVRARDGMPGHAKSEGRGIPVTCSGKPGCLMSPAH
jgi:hypothetical protein